jgi:hypothetical protein
VRLVDQLIAYEEGQITEDQEVAFFEHLVETGTCWQLSGHYQRVAATLIEAGLIKPPELAEANLQQSGLGCAQNLGFQPLYPSCSPLRCFERLGVVAGISPHLPVPKLDDGHDHKYLPAAVIVDSLGDPQPIPNQHPTQPDARRVGVRFLERPHVLPPRMHSPDWGISIT